MSTSPPVAHNPSPPSSVRIFEDSSKPIQNGLAPLSATRPPTVTAAPSWLPPANRPSIAGDVAVTSGEEESALSGKTRGPQATKEARLHDQRQSTIPGENKEGDRYSTSDIASSPEAQPGYPLGEKLQYAKATSWGKTPTGGLSNLSVHRALLNPSYKDRGASLGYSEKHRSSHNLPPFISPVDSPVDRPSTPHDTTSPFMADALGTRPHNDSPSYSRQGEERAWSIGNERSSSKARNQGQVEKSIAATLANVETTARSRKTSHSLGLFKENAVPKEVKRREDKGERSGRGDFSSASKPGEVPENEAEGFDGGRPSIRPYRTPRSQTVSESDTHASRLALALEPAAEKQDALTRASTISHPYQSPEFAKLEADESSGSKSLQVVSEAVEHGDTASLSEQALARKFPVRLLDEIRSRHNLTPGADRGTSFSRSIPTTISERSRSQSLQRQPWTSEMHEDVKADDVEIPEEQDETERGSAVEDVEESDHDEIESALYFPHQTPMNNDIDDLRPRTHPDGQQEDIAQNLTSEALDHHRSEAECVDGREVDISLQTESENNFLHGDIKVPQSASSETSDQSYHSTSERGFSSASESDYESLDEGGMAPESSFTDDLETTPTATPVAPALITRHKERHPRNSSHHHVPKAVGAVELKPYKHQVGGHTTVFRFSRRAVCKPLSNRENEFYETVERRHRELLVFLPRYIGVLNVTFRKASKKKKTKKEPDQAADQAEDPAFNTLNGLTPNKNSKASSSIPTTTLDPPASNGNQPRVVSHSQQPIPTPQVIFENNRHIIPENLFKLPSRRRNDRWLSASYTEDSSSAKRDSLDPKSKSNSPPLVESHTRPPLVKQHSSWGATTVNRKLQEQVLREVFSSPQIHQHHKHSRSHHVVPPTEASKDSRYKATAKYATLPARRSSADLGAGHPGLFEEPSTRKMVLKNEAERSWSIHNGASTPKPTGNKAGLTNGEAPNDLSRVRTEEIIEAPSSARRIKRRHSGGGLRRRRLTVNGDEKAELAYFEDDGYGGDREDEVFAMDEDASKNAAPLKVDASPAGLQVADDVSLIGKYVTLNLPKEDTEDVEDSSGTEPLLTARSNLVASSPHTAILPNSPSNPMEAQIQSDQRVEHFLLLEDVTAGMKRPCVLDLKMGTRQYGLDANKKKQESQRQKGAMTTSRKLGVRVCGMQVWNARDEAYLYQDKYFGRSLKVGREFQDALTRFLDNGLSDVSVLKHISDILVKLTSLETKIKSLRGYRFYASSLLILYDGDPEEAKSPSVSRRHSVSHGGQENHVGLAKSTVDLKIVDFANCVTAEDIIPEDTPCPPKDPDGVDRGFLRGLRSLKAYLQRIHADISEHTHGPDEQDASFMGPDDEQHTTDEADDDAGNSDVSI